MVAAGTPKSCGDCLRKIKPKTWSLTVMQDEGEHGTPENPV